jgi:hypothetical protein
MDEKKLTAEENAINDFEEMIVGILSQGGFKSFADLDKYRESLRVLKNLITEKSAEE